MLLIRLFYFSLLIVLTGMEQNGAESETSGSEPTNSSSTLNNDSNRTLTEKEIKDGLNERTLRILTSLEMKEYTTRKSAAFWQNFGHVPELDARVKVHFNVLACRNCRTSYCYHRKKVITAIDL